MNEPNLPREAGLLQGFASMIRRGIADPDRLAAELEAMAKRLHGTATKEECDGKEEWAIERIIDAFWHTDPDRPVDAADLIGFRKVAEMAERIEQVGGFPAGTAGLFARVLDALEPAPPSREGE